MSQFSETAIFPGKILNAQQAIVGSSATTGTIFTADATYAGIVRGIVMYEKGSGGARTCRLELKNGSTTTVLSRFATSGAQYTSTNLFTSDFIPGLNDADPVLNLMPGDSLQLTTEDTNNNALDVTVFGGTFEYPN